MCMWLVSLFRAAWKWANCEIRVACLHLGVMVAVRGRPSTTPNNTQPLEPLGTQRRLPLSFSECGVKEELIKVRQKRRQQFAPS